MMAMMKVMATLAMMSISVADIYLREALAGTAAIATLERFAASSKRGRSRLDEILANPPTPPSLVPPPPRSGSSILACQSDLDSASGVAPASMRCLAKAEVCEMCETQHPAQTLSPPLDKGRS